MTAFKEVVYVYEQLKNDYEISGYSDDSEDLITNYNNAFIISTELEI